MLTNKKNRKIQAVLTLTLVLVLTGMGQPSRAGWFKMGKDRDRDDRRPLIHRFCDSPWRCLQAGELRDDGFGRWALGDLELAIPAGCAIEVDGVSCSRPVPGYRALVLGSVIGRTIIARRIHIVTAGDDAPPADRDRYRIQWSEANPHVGWSTVQEIE